MGALDNLMAAPAAKAAVPAPSGGALDQLVSKPPKSALDSLVDEASKVPPAPKNLLESAVQPITRLPAVYQQTAAKNARDLGRAIEDFKSPTIGGKALAALETLGGVASYAASPIEAAIKAIA